MPGNHSCFCTPGPGDRLRLGPTRSPRLARPTRPSPSRTRARTGSSALTRSPTRAVTSHSSLIPGGPGPPGPTRTARAGGGRATLGPVSESNRGRLSGHNKSRLSEPPLLRMLSLRRLADSSVPDSAATLQGKVAANLNAAGSLAARAQHHLPG